MPRMLHENLDSFLGAIIPAVGTDISIEVVPCQVIIHCNGHEVIYEFREGSHSTRIDSTFAFARAIVGGLLIGLRAAQLRGVISGNMKIVEYMNNNEWALTSELPGSNLRSSRFVVQIVGDTM